MRPGALRPSRMRTLLLVSLLALSFGLTALSLLAVRYTLQRQLQQDLRSDLQHSVDTFLNLEHQRREMLFRETALLADLPSLKALMTTQDARTMQDGGKDFWKISGSDLFQLYRPDGQLIVSYGRGLSPDGIPAPAFREASVKLGLDQTEEMRTLAADGRLYEITAHSLIFGPRSDGTLLGYVVLGSSIDENVAGQVSQATAAKVAFTLNGRVVVSTLGRRLQLALSEDTSIDKLHLGKVTDMRLSGQRYLVAVQPLSDASSADLSHVDLIVLRSRTDATRLAMALNGWLLGLGALALVLGTVIAVSISRRVTRPLESLVECARALGRGDFHYQLATGGTAEILELASAFNHMQRELQSSQRALVDSERLATIGRMASSISHDLRHYLSAMYANAEFLSLASTPQAEREELIFEVESAVRGMTDLLDSLLGFSRTGKTLSPSYESIPFLIERAAALLCAHPEGRSLQIDLEALPAVEAWVDATKFVRAVFNLLLNACQAANRGSLVPSVTLALSEQTNRSATEDLNPARHSDLNEIVIDITDNGPGVPAALVSTMFEPFVSHGRENGSGLGLTLAQHIAQEHGGLVQLQQSSPGKTVFRLSLNKQTLGLLRQGSAGAEISPNATAENTRSHR